MSDWNAYYRAGAGRAPRQEFLAALADAPADAPRSAVDLGAGDGTESRHLLDAGWTVHATDLTPGLRARILAGAPDPGDRLTIAEAPFAALTTLPHASFVYAGLSLPFATDAELVHVLSLVRTALAVDGRFTAHLFGEHDDWRERHDVRTHTAADVDHLFADFEILTHTEREDDGPSGRGPKHWHVRLITARARG